MALCDHITWLIDPQTYGGVLPERLCAAVPLADGLYSGLVFNLSRTGKATVEYWERIDDLARQGFVPLSEARARALCDLPRFLERLEKAAGARAEAPEQEDGSSVG
jgi:hypothetical protein